MIGTICSMCLWRASGTKAVGAVLVGPTLEQMGAVHEAEHSFQEMLLYLEGDLDFEVTWEMVEVVEWYHVPRYDDHGELSVSDWYPRLKVAHDWIAEGRWRPEPKLQRVLDSIREEQGVRPRNGADSAGSRGLGVGS